MVRAWYRDDSDDARTSPHMTDPPRFVQLEFLEQKCGVKVLQIDMSKSNWEEQINQLKEEKKYINEDVVTFSGSADSEKFDKYYTEHLHADDEARFTVDGSGYFEIRDPTGEKEEWIRIEVQKGDFLLLPGGIYHRFTLDPKGYWKANRYFTEVPAWEGFPRPHDDHPARLSYVKKYCRK